MAPSWSASVVQHYGSTAIGANKGTFLYDLPGQRWRLTGCSLQTIFHPDEYLCMDQLARNLSGPTGLNMNITIGNGSDAVCKAFPNPYYDILFLQLMPLATHQGIKTVDGVPCDIWTVSLKVPTYEMNLSTCIASDGVPREHNLTSGMAYKAASAQYYRFSNVSVGSRGEDAFAPGEVCETMFPRPPCPKDTVESLDVYRVRSAKEPNELANRNLGDALGDMAFFCGVGGMDETQVVTHWSAQANSSWGQYGYCMYIAGRNVCFGNTGNHVGRESAEGLGEGAVQGQCSPNEDVGSWFSFPADGLCPEGARVGDGGCTWTAKPIRTVSASCILNERGLKDSCASERGHAPMTKSAAIFKAALETSDPTQGGCPDVTEVTGAAMLVV